MGSSIPKVLMMKTTKQIILIEDDEVDVLTFNRALKEIGVSNSVVHFESAYSALEHYRNNDSTQSSIVVLDINMPAFDGFDFLRERVSVPSLSKLPVVVLTTSNNTKDIEKCYELGASGYMVKEIEYENYRRVVESILIYWNNCE